METPVSHAEIAQNVSSQSPNQQEKHTLATFQNHVAAFQSASLDKVMDDFADDAIVFTPDGVFEGKQQIRKVYAALLDEFGCIDRGDSPGILLDAMYVRDDSLFITWHAVSRQHQFDFGTDTFVVTDDKIARQSIAYAQPKVRT
ncbi:MAG TPA: nuclear transport factor 2 family protein [Gammaproteobacteria bacterium]